MIPAAGRSARRAKGAWSPAPAGLRIRMRKMTGGRSIRDRIIYRETGFRQSAGPVSDIEERVISAVPSTSPPAVSKTIFRIRFR